MFNLFKQIKTIQQEKIKTYNTNLVNFQNSYNTYTNSYNNLVTKNAQAWTQYKTKPSNVTERSPPSIPPSMSQHIIIIINY